jgi:predicted lipid carrier protein YhbT
MLAARKPSICPVVIPRLLALPLGIIPGRAQTEVLARLLNHLFAPELKDGELDFLEQRVMRIRVDDARLEYRLTLVDRRLKAAPVRQTEDLSIEGNTYEFLLLATRREDPDTLFFNRRLRLGGSTELGLYVKNFLDSLDLEERLGIILKLLHGATNVLGQCNRQHPLH